MPNFAIDPKSLADINSVRVADMPSVWAWQDRATQADNTVLSDLMRAAKEEQQLSPTRVKQADATLESTILGNKGKRLDNTSKEMSNELEAYLLPKKKISEFKKLIVDGSESDRKVAENKIYEMLRSPDPKTRAIGQQLYPTLKSAADEAYKSDLVTQGQLKVAGANNAAALGRQKNLFEQQRTLQEMRDKAAFDRAQIRKAQAEAGKDPKKWQEIAGSLFMKWRTMPEGEARDEVENEMQFAQTMAERLGPVAAPQVNPATVGNGKLVPGREPMPSPSGAKPGSKENPIILK